MDDVAFEFPCGVDIYKGAVVKLIWYRLMSIGRQPYMTQGGGVGGERKCMPALISTFENFLAI